LPYGRINTIYGSIKKSAKYHSISISTPNNLTPEIKDKVVEHLMKCYPPKMQ